MKKTELKNPCVWCGSFEAKECLDVSGRGLCTDCFRNGYGATKNE